MMECQPGDRMGAMSFRRLRAAARRAAHRLPVPMGVTEAHQRHRMGVADQRVVLDRQRTRRPHRGERARIYRLRRILPIRTFTSEAIIGISGTCSLSTSSAISVWVDLGLSPAVDTRITWVQLIPIMPPMAIMPPLAESRLRCQWPHPCRFG